MILLAASPAQHFFTAFGAGIAGPGLILLAIGWIIHRTSRHMRGPVERGRGHDRRLLHQHPGCPPHPRNARERHALGWIHRQLFGGAFAALGILILIASR